RHHHRRPHAHRPGYRGHPAGGDPGGRQERAQRHPPRPDRRDRRLAGLAHARTIAGHAGRPAAPRPVQLPPGGRPPLPPPPPAPPPTRGEGEPQAAGKGKQTAPLRVCLVSGSLEYESDASLSALQKYLEKQYPVKCTRAFRKTDDDLPGLENLESCDVMLLFT